MNRQLATRLIRYARLLALWAATGLCGVLTALLLGFFWLGNQDTVSIYQLRQLQITEQGHAGPKSLTEAVETIETVANCNLAASVSPGMHTVTLKLDICGRFQFYYFRQHARRLA